VKQEWNTIKVFPDLSGTGENLPSCNACLELMVQLKMYQLPWDTWLSIFWHRYYCKNTEKQSSSAAKGCY
jgi:hypothetical protein